MARTTERTIDHWRRRLTADAESLKNAGGDVEREAGRIRMLANNLEFPVVRELLLRGALRDLADAVVGALVPYLDDDRTYDAYGQDWGGTLSLGPLGVRFPARGLLVRLASPVVLSKTEHLLRSDSQPTRDAAAYVILRCSPSVQHVVAIAEDRAIGRENRLDAIKRLEGIADDTGDGALLNVAAEALMTVPD